MHDSLKIHPSYRMIVFPNAAGKKPFLSSPIANDALLTIEIIGISGQLCFKTATVKKVFNGKFNNAASLASGFYVIFNDRG